MEIKEPHLIEVIAPNLNRRLSGVTSTIVRLVPLQAKKINIAAFGAGLPDFLPKLSLAQLLQLPAKPIGQLRVWHARRNVEMILGLALNKLFRQNHKLLFTSASQRKHTWITRFLIKQMDHVIATSHAGKKYLTVPADVVHHGIDIEKFNVPKDKETIKKRLNLPNAKLIGCVGRIRKQKGTDVFVDAMIEILPNHPEWHAVILGRATLSHTLFLNGLKKKIADAGLSDRIHFPDEVPTHEVAAWYQSLSLFVAPQRWEGFGLTPLEAMACGVPVVATKVGAFSELIVEEETGNLIDIANVEQMSSSVTTLIESPKKLNAFSKAARKRMAEKFGLDVEANNLIKIYKSLI